MKQEILTIRENVPVTGSVYRMQLEGAELEAQKPGGFVNIRLDGLFLRRPISVFDSAPGSLTILYKVVGKGTEQMSGMKAGETLDVLTGLGNGYDLAKAGDHPLLLGGGVGVPPLYLLAKQLIAAGKKVSAVLGFNIEATRGTARFLKENGIRTHAMLKLSQGSDEILNSIRQGHVAYIINTREIGEAESESDGLQIRRCATENNATIFTSLDTVRVLLDVLEETTLTISTIDA